MTAPTPAAQYPRLVQAPGRVSRKALDGLDHLVVILPTNPAAQHWRAIPNHTSLKAAARRAGKAATITGRLGNKRGTGVSLIRLPATTRDSFSHQQLAGKLLKAALAEQPGTLGFMLPGLDADRQLQLADALLLAAHAHSFAMPEIRSKAPRQRPLKTIKLLGLDERVDLTQSETAARAQNLARWLTALPPNVLNASSYRKLIKQLAGQYGWSMRFLGEERLKKLHAGAFLAVSQGNADRDAGIIHLRYQPTKRRSELPKLALVGKGILFDTGGNNLKSHKSMLDMHEDMAGSAVALGTLQALTELDYAQTVDCWLAVTENRASATAYRPRDVVTASNGVTIEVIHTDAEGRMVLADTLALAGREKPGLVFDYATLTGTCVYALTERYSGVFANRTAFNALLTDAGRRCGERVWPFPMDADYDEDLKSKVADVLQCSTAGGGDHNLAARFLQRFVPQQSGWIHVDLSAASRKSGLGHVPGGATGFGVRLTLECLYGYRDTIRQVLAGRPE